MADVKLIDLVAHRNDMATDSRIYVVKIDGTDGYANPIDILTPIMSKVGVADKIVQYGTNGLVTAGSGGFATVGGLTAGGANTSGLLTELISGDIWQLMLRNPTESLTEYTGIAFATGTGAFGNTNTLAQIRAVPTQIHPSSLKSKLDFLTNRGDSVPSVGMSLEAGNLTLTGGLYAQATSEITSSDVTPLVIDGNAGDNRCFMNFQNILGDNYFGVTGTNIFTWRINGEAGGDEIARLDASGNLTVIGGLTANSPGVSTYAFNLGVTDYGRTHGRLMKKSGQQEHYEYIDGSGVQHVWDIGSSTGNYLWRKGTDTDLMSLSSTGNLILTGGLTVDTDTLYIDSTTHRVAIGSTDTTTTLLDSTIIPDFRVYASAGCYVSLKAGGLNHEAMYSVENDAKQYRFGIGINDEWTIYDDTANAVRMSIASTGDLTVTGGVTAGDDVLLTTPQATTTTVIGIVPEGTSADLAKMRYGFGQGTGTFRAGMEIEQVWDGSFTDYELNFYVTNGGVGAQLLGMTLDKDKNLAVTGGITAGDDVLVTKTSATALVVEDGSSANIVTVDSDDGVCKLGKDAGSGHLLDQKVFQNVTTANVTLATTNRSSFFMVEGEKTTDNTVRFADIVFGIGGGSTAVISSHVRGSAAARTYSMSSGNFRLLMASDTYKVRVTKIGY